MIALLDGLAVAIAPLLAVLFIGKVAENAADYSLNNTLRNMLWLPTTREMKYKAKQAVDTFFVRMGDVASGVLVALGAGVLQLGVRAFAISNAVLVLAWLALARAIVKEHRRLEAANAGAPSA
jgi:AAA family ATP:ADP antiporter